MNIINLRALLKQSLALVFITVLSLPAWAIDLDSAKQKGLVGETPSGYLASVANAPSVDVQQLIASINQQRKEAYADSAQKTGVTVEVIAKRTAQRLYQRAKSGEYYQQPDGRWVQQP
jgi:uncharacterized protein YdbL (DUF1318 family)